MAVAYLYDADNNVTTKVEKVTGFKKDLLPDSTKFSYNIKSDYYGEVLVSHTDFNIMILPDEIDLEEGTNLTDYMEQAEDLKKYEIVSPVTDSEKITQMQEMIIELTMFLASKG